MHGVTYCKYTYIKRTVVTIIIKSLIEFQFIMKVKSHNYIVLCRTLTVRGYL